MAHPINIAEDRKELPARPNEPYWFNIERGQGVGFRKIDRERAYWLARRRPDDGGVKYEYHSLGEDRPEFGWKQAKAAAEAWFELRAGGVVTNNPELQIVEQACRAYVAERRASKSPACAHDADKRFERTVYGKPFGNLKLRTLRAEHVQKWRDGLGLKPGATNRTLTALKAALYMAVVAKSAPPALREDLRRVKALPGAVKRRELYLDRKARAKLLSCAQGAVRDLIEAAALTGARAGELTRATVSQFDARTASMTFVTGKQRRDGGRRVVPLSPAAVRLFKRLSKGRPGDKSMFLRDDGTAWAHSAWDEPVRAAAVAAGLPADPHTGVCMYTLRHCWLTDTLRAGMSVLDVARLGGTSIHMLENAYGHLVSHAARAALAKVKLL